MKYVCDAPGRQTWFRIETELEAEQESALMDHAVAKHFKREREAAIRSFRPASEHYIEQGIGLASHIQRAMPLFLTLRDSNGAALVTAMLPPRGRDDIYFKIVIVGNGNRDPYPDHEPAIQALAAHVGFALERERCFPYRR